jgi:LPS-assembly protein
MTAPRLQFLTSSAVLAVLTCLAQSPLAQAQIAPDQTAIGTNRALKLPADSPFRDPNIIYLEADELINDEGAQVLTAIGEVEGRYQDRTLRADRVDYNLETGMVLATGNVALIDATGDVQYADKLELSDELQAGTAANYSARLASGATTAARFVTRKENGEFELFNAFYTACEICEASDGSAEVPTWRLRARKVRQDTNSRTIRYNDAVLELFGVPVFYTPYLAHPDPSADRQSGLLTPFIGISGARGLSTRIPYFWAIDDHTDLTITPHIYSKVNPLLAFEGRRKFATGEINLAASLTYATLFDRNGQALDNPALFTNPADVPEGAEFSNHFFLDGYFKPSDIWHYGYTVQLVTDDNYFDRYDVSSRFKSNGLISSINRRNTTQAFIAGQGENFRLSALAVGYQNLGTTFLENENTGLINVLRDNDDALPIIAPRIDGEYYVSDPVIGGRLRLFGNATALTREDGNDYARGSIGADYSKTWVTPIGLEAKPFLWGRFDTFEFGTDEATVSGNTVEGSDISFSRTVGQAGLDLRYPFIRRGENVDVIVEPRLLYTESFGNARIDDFVDPVTGDTLFEDGTSPDLDPALLFEPNKADGYDFFQEGRRLDIGTSIKAQFEAFGQNGLGSIFVGRSYSDNVSDDFGFASGLVGDQSDWVSEIDLKLGRWLNSNTRLRYDDDRDVFSRVDTTLSLRTRYVDVTGRYFTLDSNADLSNTFIGAPPEEISGGVTVRPLDGLSLGYRIIRDLDASTTRSQRFSLAYADDCSRIELFYVKRNFANDTIRDNDNFGIRISLTTLGSLGSN